MQILRTVLLAGMDRDLQFDGLTQTADGAANGGSGLCVDGPGTASNALAARLCPAMPDTDGSPLDRVLATERAGVGGVLGDLHLLHLFSQRRTITRAVLADDADLSCALPHCECV